MRIRHAVGAKVVAVVAGMTMVAGLLGTAAASATEETTDGSAAAAAPRPVFDDMFADPAVTWAGDQYVAMATGPVGPLITAPRGRGPWRYRHGALTRLPTWSNGGGIWAPEIQHVRGDTWVMFYATRVTGLVDRNQRCIGVAVSTNGPDSRYTPVDSRPLVCPPGSDHRGASAPVTGGVGLIDPSTFTTRDGRNILLFKSQRPNPGTRLWSLRLNRNWTEPVGGSGVLLSRARGQIENPHMIRRNGRYYLFASWNNWANCSYKTVWLKNNRARKGWDLPAGFPNRKSSRGGTLIESGRGLCGPGGLTVAWRNGNPNFFLHAYRDANRDGVRDSSIRRLYAGRLGQTSTGAPRIRYFVSPR